MVIYETKRMLSSPEWKMSELIMVSASHFCRRLKYIFLESCFPPFIKVSLANISFFHYKSDNEREANFTITFRLLSVITFSLPERTKNLKCSLEMRSELLSSSSGSSPLAIL